MHLRRVHAARRLLVAAVAATAVTLVAAWPAPADAQAGNPKRGGSLSISLEADPPTLDPAGLASFNDRQAGITLYDTLLDIDPKGRLVPNLAERFEQAPDATWFKLTLRSGVTFHDDTPFDAQAVVAHFKRLMDPKVRCRCLSDLAPIASVEATGPLEVTLKMKAPSAHFPATLADVAGMVVSPTAMQTLGADFGTRPVGAGPFRFKEWRRGSHIVFERNTRYWKGPVHLDEVVLRAMPDEQTRYASLQAGNLDIVMNAAARNIVDARRDKKFTILDPGSLATVFVMVNVSQPDVSDRRVRLAMTHALDREALNKAINRGVYKVANTPFGTGLAPHEAVDGFPKYDPARAKKLLAEYGKPVRIKLSVNAAPISVLTGQALQQMWKKVGIETEIVQYEQVQLVRTAAAKQYQVMLYRWAGGADPDKNVHQFFHSKGAVNRTAYSDPEMDRLLDAGRATTDPAERLKVYRQINNLLARDLPYIYLNYFTNYSLASPAVRGVVAVPDGLIRLGGVWKER